MLLAAFAQQSDPALIACSIRSLPLAVLQERTLLSRGLAVFCVSDTCVVGIKIDNPTTDNGGNSGARHRSAMKRCVATLRFRSRRVEDPFARRVKNRHISVGVLR